ncbi:hypothetical protein AJ88_34725 [Mesorhizobium amorphae CCBAU 01583]|nr:hypothetical protein AJ88_34725 [Mesorhizobium amorphae CCBAU 01583]
MEGEMFQDYCGHLIHGRLAAVYRDRTQPNHPRNRSVCHWILPSIFIGLWIIRRFGKCSG